ncbi:MAG: SMP-30/gluconolactonase/LRE family protein, partial [Rhodospirillales bacterium]
AFDFDLEAGEPSNQRVFAQVPAGAGVPDGLTVDSEGHVWSAHWDGWRITRYGPDGAIVRVIDMPVPRPTSCMFGGPELGTLYVTSASIGLDRRQRAKAPLSGGLFEIEVGVKGLPEPYFAG